ncbi:MAG: hypothetical protein U0R80_04430 [Nocardioidaceae bacterium]
MTRSALGRGRSRLALVVMLAVAAVVAAGVTVAVAAPSARPLQTPAAVQDHHGGRVLLEDYFNVSPDPAWQFVNREGRVAGGQLVIDGGYVAEPWGRDGWAMTHVGDRRWRSYSFAATFDTSNVGGSPAEVHGADFFVRVSDTGATGTGTYYRITIWDPGMPDPTGSDHDMSQGLASVQRYVAGQTTTLGMRWHTNTVTGTNQIVVRVHGSRIVVVVNGECILRTHDPVPLHFGGVGVGHIWETNGWFDNVVVWRDR